MLHKEKEPLTFRKVVSNRYKTDTIMNPLTTMVVIIMPLVVLGVVSFCIDHLSHLAVLDNFSTVVVGIPFMIELFVIMAILYQMYSRLCTHSKRDNDWRDKLIEFEDKVGADSTDLRKMDQSIRNREAFVIKGLIKVLMLAMFIFDLILFLIFFPQWHHDGIDYTVSVMMVGVLLCLTQTVLISYSALTFAFRHESLQSDFTIQFSADLAKKGIHVPPMIRIIKHYNIFVHLLLILFTCGLWVLYLIYMMFHGMNNHLMNQWEYESELLKVIESNGMRKFENYLPDYYCATDLTKRQKKKLNKKNFAAVRNKVKGANRMPLNLYIAELFLIFLCANYMLKIIALDCEICDNYTLYQLSLLDLSTFRNLTRQQWYYLIMVGLQLFFLMTTIFSLLGIASRKPSAWRKVVRSCVTFLIPLWFSRFLISTSGITHIFDLNVFLMSVILVAILLIMLFKENIREFYAPVGDEMPETLEWIKYAFFGELGSKELDYEINLDEGEILP